MENKEKMDQMIHDEMFKNLDRIEELLQYLYKKIQNNPEDKEMIKIFEGILYIAKNEVRTNADISATYFSKEIKEYSVELAKKREHLLRNIDIKEITSKKNRRK